MNPYPIYLQTQQDRICYYYSIDKLLADNGRVIYFDRDYDTTNYDIIEEKFKKEKNTLSPDELELYISEEFKNSGLKN